MAQSVGIVPFHSKYLVHHANFRVEQQPQIFLWVGLPSFVHLLHDLPHRETTVWWQHGVDGVIKSQIIDIFKSGDFPGCGSSSMSTAPFTFRALATIASVVFLPLALAMPCPPALSVCTTTVRALGWFLLHFSFKFRKNRSNCQNQRRTLNPWSFCPL